MFSIGLYRRRGWDSYHLFDWMKRVDLHSLAIWRLILYCQLTGVVHHSVSMLVVKENLLFFSHDNMYWQLGLPTSSWLFLPVCFVLNRCALFVYFFNNTVFCLLFRFHLFSSGRRSGSSLQKSLPPTQTRSTGAMTFQDCGSVETLFHIWVE